MQEKLKWRWRGEKNKEQRSETKLLRIHHAVDAESLNDVRFRSTLIRRELKTVASAEGGL